VRLETQQGGEFIIEASSVSATDSGAYLLEVQDVGTLEPITDRVVTVGQLMEDTLELGDVHSWQLMVQAGETYRMTMERTNDDVDPYLTLTDAGGGILMEDDDSAGNLNAQITYTFTAAGTYFVEARSYTLTTSGGYVLRVEPVEQGIDEERVLEVGVSQRVLLNVTEVHVWQFEAQAGQTYVITMDNASGTIDPRLTLKDAAGSILAENDDKPGSFNSLITFTPTTSGLYFVEASTYSPDESGEYIIQVALEG
jgi:hypothetical protein